MEYREWESRTRQNLGELLDAGCYETGHQLWQAYLEYSAEKNEQAASLLEPLSRRTFEPGEEELEGGYVYLAGELGLLEEGEKFHRADPDALQAPSRQRASSDAFAADGQEFLNSPVKQLYLMEKQFEIGGKQPVSLPVGLSASL